VYLFSLRKLGKRWRTESPLDGRFTGARHHPLPFSQRTVLHRINTQIAVHHRLLASVTNRVQLGDTKGETRDSIVDIHEEA
jgi:hypothetical protein